MIYPINNESINFAKSLIDDGEIIAYPTDTLYGFGVDATNSNAINKLNLLKGRTQPLSIIISNISDVNQYAILSNETKKHIIKFLPGPYTLLLEKKDSHLSDLITYGSELIGIRIPKHDFPINLVKKINKPIVTTSINKKGSTPLNLTDNIEDNYPEISIFEDQEQETNNSMGSTIIKILNDKITLIRQGDGIFPK
tara:strand:- start:8 stop:595 length:588 start_codon:yes stop_codon:yes gene_type:complete